MVRTRPINGLPTTLAALVTASALAAWDHATKSTSPTVGLESVADERVLWIGAGLGPVGVCGDLESSDVVVVGDSRVGHAIHLSIAGSLGIGRVATLWGSGAKTEHLLRALDELEPRGLVVALSVLGLSGFKNQPITESLRERNPAFEPENPPRVVRDWSRAEHAHLLQKGFSETVAKASLDWWIDMHRASRAQLLRSQRRLETDTIDERLAHRVDRWRTLVTQPIEPTEWRSAWFATAMPRASDAAYRALTVPEKAVERAQEAERLGRRLEELRERGWRIACVRLPNDPELREIEDASDTGELVAGIAEGLGLPLLDFGPWPNATSDGSHLNWRAADRVTRELARWLREELGWHMP
jgi:hypothetical protein